MNSVSTRWNHVIVPHRCSTVRSTFNDLRSEQTCVDLGPSSSHADLTRCCLRAPTEVYRKGFKLGVEGSISRKVWVYATK
ncbi:uncharacterized protein LACBIDRAFT_297616 [Laccaria bicolor S238N-H82]|uniref:Predicted protein n=1 Tax=Laccaria bicolor (strain S238N-H82 / ATCC MYA-4686) TaxID=486041 RepID=B0DBL6_LACBS|nr:uncharacterized protein LACBIDRAFT_297616 [Laccaria bicolor S238N-H82]EDR08021.1 predicted protein [Laccaria bicolor S238N-H82]|eukprot:XP_001881091.1 predicted protein [Laccaria bicolor S238N-H82]